MRYTKFLFLFYMVFALIGCETQQVNEWQEEHLHLVSFNIRYDDNPRDGINRWINRIPLVESYFKAESPDIIGLQEVFYNQLVDFQEMLPGYAYVGTGRNDGKRGGEHSPIFYKTSKFRHIEDGQFWLSETPDVPGSLGWDSALPRIVTWVALQHIDSGKAFFCFSTHFTTSEGQIARGKSIDLMSDKMKDIAGDELIIAMGDFNIGGGDHYNQLMNTFRDHNSLQNSAYNANTVISAGATTNGFNPNWRETIKSRSAIDYIFVSNFFDVHSYRVDRATAHTEQGEILISDHWPIVSKISFSY